MPYKLIPTSLYPCGSAQWREKGGEYCRTARGEAAGQALPGSGIPLGIVGRLNRNDTRGPLWCRPRIGFGTVVAQIVEFEQDFAQGFGGFEAHLQKVGAPILLRERHPVEHLERGKQHGCRLAEVMAHGAQAFHHHLVTLHHALGLFRAAAVADVDQREHHADQRGRQPQMNAGTAWCRPGAGGRLPRARSGPP